MAEVNRAYEEGHEDRLRSILVEWESGPDVVRGTDIGAELVRAIRKIAQAKHRLQVIGEEIAKLKQSDLYQLKVKADEASLGGRNLLVEMGALQDRRIEDARQRLSRLQ